MKQSKCIIYATTKETVSTSIYKGLPGSKLKWAETLHTVFTSHQQQISKNGKESTTFLS